MNHIVVTDKAPLMGRRDRRWIISF